MQQEPTAEKVENKKIKEPLKSLRTYQGDVDEAISKNKYSATSILIAEQKRKEDNPESEKPISHFRNKFFVTIGISFLVIGVVVVGVVYYLQKNQKVVIEQKTKTLVGFSLEKDVSIENSSRENLLTTILQEKKSFNLPINSILYLNIVNRDNTEARIENALSLLSPNMPPSLARSFGDKYMLGLFSFDTNEFFIILTTKDYASSFSGMLKWEKVIGKDIGRLFDIEENTGTSTSVFLDEELNNKDLRILKDTSNKTVLLYSFIDKDTLVITKNQNIFTAIVGKYLVNKQVR